jgi:hypothetical protein
VDRKPELGPVRGRFHKLRLAVRPPHPDLLHSPSKTDVNALMARGEKETACAWICAVPYLRTASICTISMRAALSNWFTVARPLFGSSRAWPDL